MENSQKINNNLGSNSSTSNNPFENVEAIPRKVLPMFFLIDTSGSMAGEKIGSLNSAMEELLLELRSMSDGSVDAEIKIAVLEFSSGCKWNTPGLVSVEAYGDWQTLTASGVTDMGAAFFELDGKLSRKDGYMVSPSGMYAPIIYLMSDGYPIGDYERGLVQLKKNNWFKASLKIALAIGQDADEKILEKFTGDRELIVHANTKEQLSKMIYLVSITSASIGSKSRGIGMNNGEADPTKLDPKMGAGEIARVIRMNNPEAASEGKSNKEWDW